MKRFVLAILVAFTPAAAWAQQPAVAAVPPAFASIAGIVDDSLRGGPLAGALVIVVGTARSATTDTRGAFVIDSITPGTHSIAVMHPMLDTLGFKVVSVPFDVTAGLQQRVNAHTPSAAQIRATLCTNGPVGYGPSILVGRVSVADTDEPAEGAAVSLVFKDLNTPNSPDKVRTGRVAASGVFAICGVPSKLDGTVQASLSGNATADLPIKLNGELVATTMLSLGVGGNGGAVLKGIVKTKNGAPVAGAQVTLAGTTAVATTAADGTFILTALPTGTHEAVIRKIGYAQTSKVVTLSAHEPASVTVALGDAQALETVKVTGKLDNGLAKVGFTDRKNVGLGKFFTPDDIEQKHPLLATDVLRATGGLRVTQGLHGRTLEVTRGPGGTSDACLNVFIDHVRFEQLGDGDLDTAIPVEDLGAIEFYGSASSTPPDFHVAGRNCATVAIWSKTMLQKRGN